MIAIDWRLPADPEEVRSLFLALSRPEDIAELLGIEFKQIRYYLYVLSSEQRYTQFSIPKRSGGYRIISAPVSGLKRMQERLNAALQCVFSANLKPCVHGFVMERSIVTNARLHAGRRYVFNADIEKFFPSINFGRVRGMFMAKPYQLNSSVATVIAQICCNDNELPQGAPTSPTISNMICARLDSQLLHLAKRTRCLYSRYADDITFSCSSASFPKDVATINSFGQVNAGEVFEQIIRDNGFQLNLEKVRLQSRDKRQEVTGLVTNKFPNVERRYVRQIRAMLHAWEKFGLTAAETEFHGKYDTKHRRNKENPASFALILKGRIEYVGMVRGKHDGVYLRFCKNLHLLDPNLMKDPGTPDETRPDEHTRLEWGLKIVKIRMASFKNTDSYNSFLVLESRLQDVINVYRTYGGDSDARAERNRVVSEMNRLCMSLFKADFNSICSARR